MQFKFFLVPALESGMVEEELNTFLRGHRILSVEKDIVHLTSAIFWSVCVEYLEGSSVSSKSNSQRIDYKEVLSEQDFAFFTKLRETRKQVADQEAIPVYAVCTNAQLAEMAKHRVSTIEELKKIDGIGNSKAEKYGQVFLGVINQLVVDSNETRG